jgi:chromosome segregation protein
VQFSRIRLSGFKSFVDATEFRIEPGLTGIVGPNGCGKSNLLEAMRWVMGANSAKAMRGEGMDDVIFAGSGARPSRNHAEVTLTVDTSDGQAPARFAAEATLEVARRIDRGEGSTYRVNGQEMRARDVQLLFADASTGANSPALVRQGQISELIAAKPQNRRRILEEAAGVSGLYGRRHEAQLRVKGAEANLLRLEDLAGELEANLGRLRREARAAARYKKLAAEIRSLQSAALHARWMDAVAARDAAAAELDQARAAAETAARQAATATAAALDALTGLPALRDEDTAAAAILHHVAIEQDRLARALESAKSEQGRLAGEVAQADADIGREAQAGQEAADALDRIVRDLAQIEREIAAAPERIPHLEAAAAEADGERGRAEAELEAAAASLAASQAEARAARTRLEEARARSGRLTQALAQASAERAALGPPEDPALAGAVATLDAATSALAQSREALEAAELAHGRAARDETEARKAARAAEDDLGRKVTEAGGLAKLVSSGPAKAFPTALDAISAEPGLEAALAAALGDDLSAALDRRAPSFWGGRDPDALAWPAGVTPLAPTIGAPPELAARLAFTGLVDRADGERLQAILPPGARLVSREGDLWRWDGFTVKAEAARPAQVRLEQKTRLAGLEAEIAVLRPRAAETRTKHEASVGALTAAARAVADARGRPRAAELDLGRARETVDRLRREGARREARAASLDETIARLEGEADAARADVEGSQAAVASIPADTVGAERLAGVRETAVRAREAAFQARAALDREIGLRDGRLRRRESLTRDRADWTRRAEAAEGRQVELAQRRRNAQESLGAALDAAPAIESGRLRLLDELAAAEMRKARAADALAAAEGHRLEADRAARAAESRVADTREARAGTEARLENTQARVEEHARAIWDAAGLTPDELGERLAAEAVALPTDSGGVETHLAALERDRDAIGAVNLLAEDEAAELTARLAAMAEERADLDGALRRLHQAIDELNTEGRERLTTAFTIIDSHFRDLFTSLFGGGSAELRLVESDDPLEAGLEILACPPGKRMAVMSLMSGGEQALTAVALIFAVFLANPAPICVLDEVDAPLDDANVERFCDLLDEMRRRASTRFLTITHNPLTMSRMDRLYGVTMREKGVSQLVSVDLRQAEALAER